MQAKSALTVAETLPKTFLRSVEVRGGKPAIREKRFGIWKSVSWRQWLETTKEVAYALDAIGFKPGDVASILSNTVVEWVYADMGVLCADNAWWMDVLEHGPASQYADFFDIDWHPVTPGLAGRVLVPVLGDQYGVTLERGELELAFDRARGAFELRYFDHRFPIDVREYPQVL